jgi:hypothetical protein
MSRTTDEAAALVTLYGAPGYPDISKAVAGLWLLERLDGGHLSFDHAAMTAEDLEDWCRSICKDAIAEGPSRPRRRSVRPRSGERPPGRRHDPRAARASRCHADPTGEGRPRVTSPSSRRLAPWRLLHGAGRGL